MCTDRTPLLRELQTVEENCLYTAQAHFDIGARRGRVTTVVFIIASIGAAVSGGLVAAGFPAWVGMIGAVFGAIAATAAALGAGKDVHHHLSAGDALTRLRHEVRALRETFSADMTKAEMTIEVRRFTDAYNDTIQGLPPTDDKALKRAREKIRFGVFTPDFRAADERDKS